MINSITKRLTLYFSILLLIFAIFIGFIFTGLFTNNVIEANKSILTTNANQIADSLSEYLESESSRRRTSGHMMMNNKSGLNSFIKIVDDISVGEVWLVDKDKNILSRSMHDKPILEEEISKEGLTLIDDALSGIPGYTDTFSVMNNNKTMTVSVPSFDSRGNILAAVLVHAPIDGANQPIKDGLSILGSSLIIALMISIVVAILLSRRFSRPIKIMNDTTKKIANEDYSVKTDINQKDEIGELALSIDTLSDKLKESKDQRDQLDKERRDFYVDVSHELRTPVTVLRGSLESLYDEKIPDDEKEDYYRQMIKETEYIQNMLNDLLDYSKINNPDYTLKKEILNLSDVLSDAIRSMRKIANHKNISIEYKNELSLIKLEGDYEKLRQMFVIVLDNSLKFSHENSSVEVFVEESSNTYVINIKDFGAGIKKEDIPYIFDRYYRDQEEGNSNGTGIGLALTKEIANRHNIEITVSSNQEGTCFTFTFQK